MSRELEDILLASRDMTLLYVEDDSEVREQTLKMLEHFFCDITTAVDGEEALDKYINSNKSYDLIISDLLMPNLDGIEMSKAILKVDPKQLIIIFTAVNDFEYRLRLRRLNIVGHLYKPIKFIDFLAILDEVNRKYKEHLVVD
jgi:CheY-like chemotaxis protein